MTGMGGHGAAVVGWLLAALCGGTAAYCVARLCARPAGADRQSDAAEALMGAGMAAMALGAAMPVAVWVVVFGAAGAWSVWVMVRRARLQGHHAYHAVGHLAMVYMAVAAAGPGMAGMAAAGVPALTGALLVACGGYALWAGTRLASGAASCAGPLRGARLPHACRLVMSLAMFCMLLGLPAG